MVATLAVACREPSSKSVGYGHQAWGKILNKV